MPSRVKAHPFLTLMAVVSAILIVVGRVNKDLWWGDWVFAVGIAVLVVAGALFLFRTKR
jgi:divalent metal cation (Fe/Co/Zn/Cd) transporter